MTELGRWPGEARASKESLVILDPFGFYFNGWNERPDLFYFNFKGKYNP
jgi:hypothetical protein